METENPVRELPGRLVLLGHPVAHSLSPTFQNAALHAAGIPLSYEAIDVAPRDLRVLLRQLKSVAAAGNVTIPHKIAVHNSCDALTDIAARVGAVNTFWFNSGQLHGDNTDVAGFDAAARALLGGDQQNARIVMFGSGGAAAAVLATVEQWPNARVEKSLGDALSDANFVVNATPVGQKDDTMPLDVGMISKSAAVMDLVYRRGGTPWVKAARAQGNRAADGLPMLIEQGALSFQRWFGFEPDREAMRKSLV